MNDLLGALEEGAVSGGTIGAGQEGISRGPASGCLNVMTVKGPTPGSEGIDMRGLDVVHSETLQLGAKVIDADQQDIGLGVSR